MLDDARRQATDELLFELLPRRRPRANPRVVKRKMSSYNVTRPEHRGLRPLYRSVRVITKEATA